MYNLNNIKRVGLIHIAGGLVVVLVGVVVQGLSTGQWSSALGSNAISLLLFGVGWYVFGQLVMGQVFATLRKGLNFNNQPMKRFSTPPPLPRRFGMDYQTIEITAMLLAAILVGVVTVAVPSNGFSLGGFAGGWLMGGGFGRQRFVRKARQEELDQERTFYFSDGSVGPRTDLAFYEAQPGKRTHEEASLERENQPGKTTADIALPPGVRRRAGGGSPAKSGSPTRKRAKVGPLVSTPQSQPQPKNISSEEKPQ